MYICDFEAYHSYHSFLQANEKYILMKEVYRKNIFIVWLHKEINMMIMTCKFLKHKANNIQSSNLWSWSSPRIQTRTHSTSSNEHLLKRYF